MIAMLPSRILLAAGDLTTRTLPIPVSGFTLHLAWLRRRDNDRALRHVAGLLTGLLKQRRRKTAALSRCPGT